jgi:O-antigen/teichoic acid export membrane protein
MKRTRNAVRNVIFGGLLKGYQILVPFIMRTLLIRYLGMEYLGLNSLFTSILQILNLAELGVGSALGYSMYAPIAEGKKDEICALLSLYRRYYCLIGLGILLAGIAAVSALAGENGQYSAGCGFVCIVSAASGSLCHQLLAVCV